MSVASSQGIFSMTFRHGCNRSVAPGCCQGAFPWARPSPGDVELSDTAELSAGRAAQSTIVVISLSDATR